jgi:hypothetical protein
MRRTGIRIRNWRPRAGLLLAAVFFLVAPAVRTHAQDWSTFKYPTDGFSATFPVAPNEDTRLIETQSGTVELHGYTLELDQVAFFVGVCDYGSMADGGGVDAMLEGAMNGALETSKAHLTHESKISLGHYHGLEYESESEEMHYTTRVYMVGNTMYQMLVVYPLSSPFSETRRFLDSFQLLGRETN